MEQIEKHYRPGVGEEIKYLEMKGKPSDDPMLM